MVNLNKLLASTILLVASTSVFAIPALQVDIDGGTYVGGSEESVMTSADSFTTYVYGDVTSSKISGSDTYYLAVAIVSADGSSIAEGSLPTIGDFSIDGTTYSLASMTYGTPPVDDEYKELASHDIYDTYYIEIAFQFDTSTQYATQNVQDNPGGLTSGTGMYAQAFDIVRTGLADGYELHFDAYGLTDPCPAGAPNSCKQKVDVFAPFSHDGGTYTVPESTSLLLLMFGLFGLLAVKRKA